MALSSGGLSALPDSSAWNVLRQAWLFPVLQVPPSELSLLTAHPYTPIPMIPIPTPQLFSISVPVGLSITLIVVCNCLFGGGLSLSLLSLRQGLSLIHLHVLGTQSCTRHMRVLNTWLSQYINISFQFRNWFFTYFLTYALQ